jgi:hypothetical protein
MSYASTVVPFGEAERAARKEKRGHAGGGGGSASTGDLDIDWSGAPFECLGVCGETWWFVDAFQQVAAFKGAVLAQRGPLVALTGGDAGNWCATNFPERNKEGDATGRFSPVMLHQAIARRMACMPHFDPEMPRRRAGVWNEGGQAIVHVGTSVLLPDQGARKPSFVRKGVAWLADRDIPAPHDGAPGREAPPAPDEVDEAEDYLRSWNWSRPASERMLMGWWTIANLGALAPMRPLGMIDGQEEAGKSTLLDTIHAMSPAAEKTNDTTEAGLRQRLAQRAAPVVLDEFEGEQLEKVLGLLRRIVTGDGSRSFRGSPDQRAVATEVTGTAIMGAIGAPVGNAAEATRILRLMLWPRAAGVQALNREELLAWAKRAGPRLWGRAIAGWPRIKGNFATLRPLLEARGASSRNAELVGWLVAAREAMASDVPLDEAAAALALEWAEPWIVTRSDQAQDSTAARCLAHLLACQVQTKPGVTTTIAALMSVAAKGDEEVHTQDCDRAMREIGMRVAPYPIEGGGPRGLYIATGRRPGLQKLFNGTEWGGGRWGTVLAQMRALHGGSEVRAVEVKGRVRFSGENDRASAVWLAGALLPSAAPRDEKMD